jgi:prepilin-type N-terminal cleavage/methylation domain-containing protein
MWTFSAISRSSSRGSIRRLAGFTLIELLIVVAIIGILAAIVALSLNAARARARDAARITALDQLHDVVEQYFADTGSYPTTGGAWWGPCTAFGSHSTTGASGYIPNVAPTYLPALPTDPIKKCGYLYNSNGKDYMMLAYGSVESYTQATNPYPRPSFDPGGPFSCSDEASYYENDFAFYTSGAECW